MERSKVCITGSSGFIGTRLLAALPKDLEAVEFSGDLLILEDVEKFFEDNPHFDTIIHMVGAFSGPIGMLLDLNVKALANLLQVAKDKGIKKVVLTSTGAVYGEPQGEVSFESDIPKPNTEYGLAKLMGEELLKFMAEANDFNYVILRFPNVYGPGNIRGVVGAFKKAIEEKGEITIFGDGEASRNFLHVDDACRAIILAAQYEGKSDIFNISNPGKVSVNDLVRAYQKKYQFKINKQPQNNFLKDLLLDTKKAREVLKFEPQITEIEV